MYVAFLRGINVGGNTLIKMAELKRALEAIGFEKVVPVLASGNVVFESAESETSVIQRKIEGVLSKEFNLRVLAIVRTAAQISQLLKSNPFKTKAMSGDIKLQVTFIAGQPRQHGKFPIRHPSRDFQIVQISEGEICSALDMSTNARTPELMTFLEKQFGKNITTRTWNTIEKIAALLASSS